MFSLLTNPILIFAAKNKFSAKFLAIFAKNLFEDFFNHEQQIRYPKFAEYFFANFVKTFFFKLSIHTVSYSLITNSIRKFAKHNFFAKVF